MKLQLKAKTILYNGNNEPNSKIDWDTNCDVPGFAIWTEIKFTAKGEIRTKFTVTPPFWMPKKDREVNTFKTTSFIELKKWLKKHKITVKPNSL